MVIRNGNTQNWARPSLAPTMSVYATFVRLKLTLKVVTGHL